MNGSCEKPFSKSVFRLNQSGSCGTSFPAEVSTEALLQCKCPLVWTTITHMCSFNHVFAHWCKILYYVSIALYIYLPTHTHGHICPRSVGKCCIWPQADTTVLMCLPPSRPDRDEFSQRAVKSGSRIEVFPCCERKVRGRDEGYAIILAACALSHSASPLSDTSIFTESFPFYLSNTQWQTLVCETLEWPAWPKECRQLFFPGLLNPDFLIIDTGVSRCVASHWARL